MVFLFAYRALAKVRRIIARSEGGIYKRIDENRELLEMLQREAPALLCQRPWIVGWIQSQDMFLSELASAAEVDDPMIKPQAGFPRSWPVSIVTTHE
ncbi:hypothetical protein RY831_04115 [Noviherbaspirillum sp. CPCC 100848]|jgi:hypothetical protein|uniref:Uncharacterized protein n=1 Tax=Noviherbaspirillum album TaxID=3080276 RepID=A0ABU6J3V7_9BURK|nr:hypothetical protein [Noviherbaspirillum sp. CPCC 100848]MEC4718321.1 hypothetical protein [Noviherbaspirillum sp. CPCC 100848]